MSELAKTYSPKEVENKWYAEWITHRCFESTPDTREAYTIVIPPPNVTGILHMGHMLNNTIQDVLIRRARMQGKNACWVPGTDHASIATEAKVVEKLRLEGIDKKNITREEFLVHAWDWTHKYGGTILQQLRQIGASCDWNRTKFTMDDDMSEAVISVFIDLYKKGYIYRGVRMINWDPQALTTLSDEEVHYKEVQSNLYYVKYKIVGTEEYITVATTRPETIMADTGIGVNPDDERYQHLVGKKAFVPLINREIPILADTYIDKAFGTGVLKITPAHDINDYNLALTHKLPVIDIFNDNGTLNQKAEILVGVDRFEARKRIAKLLAEDGLLEKIEQITNKNGFSERTNAVVEPRLSAQWFCSMQELAKPALENVMNDTIEFYPSKFKNTYKHWMENIKDWCVSRQLWWGHRIPAWYDSQRNVVVAKTLEEAYLTLQKENPTVTLEEIIQDPDCLDTWFSSWLWPLAVFDGIRNPDNPEINYYYPTSTLVTAPEILFLWVARMAIAGYEYRQDYPFKKVYYTGIVRDKQGRKMSKSLGNSPDPLELIEQYGADAVRVGMLLCSPAGNDLLFDIKYIEQGATFCNKLWNAYRLIQSWEVDTTLETPTANLQAIVWLENTLQAQTNELNDLLEKLRVSDALMLVYKLTWDSFCAWYLEAIKPTYQQPIDAFTKEKTLHFFDQLLRLLHPYTPFITEELWQHLSPRVEREFITLAQQLPTSEVANESVLKEFLLASEIVSELRNYRANKGISPKQAIDIYVKNELPCQAIIQKLGNVDSIQIVTEKPAATFALIVRQEELYLPIDENIDVEAEKEKLQKELVYSEGFLKSVQAKLANEKFVSNAKPEILANEQNKKADTEARIQAIKIELDSLTTA